MNAQDVIVREAGLADVPDMVSLLRELFSIEEDFDFNADHAQRGLELLLANPQSSHLWVSVLNGEIVGMCSLQVLISTAEGGPVGLVEDVVVRRDQRGRKIGASLLSALEGWARENGLTRLQLLADRSNTDALAFYDRMGWQPTQLIARRRLLH